MDLGPVAELAEGVAVLRKAEGQRFVCVREGDVVHALDDRCPHQGYPLSQGSVGDCVLTCEWHNWKFDLTSGACLFGGEPVRRYLTLVENGRVKLDRSVDHAKEAARLEAGLRAAFVDDDASRALREGLRLGEHRAGPPALGRLGAAFQVLAEDGAARAEYGFDHGLAMLADTVAWVERGWLSAEEAFALAATCVAEPSRHLGRRKAHHELLGGAEPTELAAALRGERREQAEALARRGTREAGARETSRAGLLPFVAGGLHDYGHGTIFLAKAEELALRFPEVAEELLASITVTLAWASNEVALPPFAATKKALLAAPTGPGAAARPFAAGEEQAYAADVLAGEKEALAATAALLAGGVSPRALLRVLARAAAERTARFDAAWEQRLDAEVGVLDVTHTVTFVEACLVLSEGAPDGLARRMALVAAGFIGKVRRGDAAVLPELAAERGSLDELVAAVHGRDVLRARRLARGLSAAERLEAYRLLAPFFALDMATRPIFVAHGVKMAEALYRLEQADPEHGSGYLDALLAFAVPRRPERRLRRVAHVATTFLADGRPPEGLY